MTYENLGGGALDYYPCRYGKSKLLFRGPKRKLDGRYIAALGGTETYGKFIARPFPDLTEQALGVKVVNLGCVNSGIDVYTQDESVIHACSSAAVTVIQITGAHNMSNRFYAVHPRRNDRFLRASTTLKSIYRDVDFTEFNFTRHLLTSLKENSETKFAMVENELKDAWVARMKSLMSRIDSTVVLLWLADHTPENYTTCTQDGTDPLFVNRTMLDALLPYAADLVEVIVTADEAQTGRDDMVYSDMEMPVVQEMLGTVAHEKAAAALKPVIEPLMH